MLSGTSRSATAALLPGWFLASSLGGLISILVSWLELSSSGLATLRAACPRQPCPKPPYLANPAPAKEPSAAPTRQSGIEYAHLYCIASSGGETGALAPSAQARKKSGRPQWDGLVWQSPPGRRGKLMLSDGGVRARRRSRVAGRLRRSRSSPGIGHQADIHAAVLGATVARSYSTRPAYPCRGRSDKSCRPERSSPKPDTESQHRRGAGSDRSCTPSCPPSRSRPRP